MSDRICQRPNNGSTEDRPEPVRVEGPPAPVAAVAGIGIDSDFDACAATVVLLADGTLWGWGHTCLGRLGFSTDRTFSGPVQLRMWEHGDVLHGGDSDGDGLSDPQESVFGTDPLLTDTDEDGGLFAKNCRTTFGNITPSQGFSIKARHLSKKA